MSLPPNRNLLADVKENKRFFVETGSYRGDAIQQALDAGYEYIISMDIDEENIAFCKNRFDLYTNPLSRIALSVMDSSFMLERVIAPIKEPVVFWLDAHMQMLDGEKLFENGFPLMDELRQIGQHRIKTHTILIDDILMMTHPSVTGWTLNDIKTAIHSINHDYRFTMIPNPVMNNLLVASI